MYASLGQIRQAIGLDASASATDTVDDPILTSCLVRASGKVDSWLTLHRPGYVGISTSSNARSAVGSNTRTYDGTGTDTLFIDDATSVSSITVFGQSIDSTSYSLWPYNDRVKRAVIYNKPLTYPMRGLYPGHWWEGTGNVSVTGFFGWPEVPPEIEQAALAVALIFWHRYQRTGSQTVVNQTMGGGPDTSPRGVRGFIVDDPEVEGLLQSALLGWAVPGVWGSGGG